LARSHHDSASDLGSILEALEEQVVLLKLLADAGSSINVKIGSEQTTANLQSTSIVSMGAGAGAIGILGPTRMDYSGSMGAVHAVARYISRYFESESR
jgi:transcriptional regulator of heat shock response